MKKRFPKRQLILAVLVLSLGTAVYLNWQFTGENTVESVNTVPVNSELGAAKLVNGEVQVDTVQSQSQADDTASVLSDPTEEGESSAAKTAEADTVPVDYFAEARLSRQKIRDAALEELQEVLENANATTEEMQNAVAESSLIAKQMVMESSIESLVKAKGYTDCVAFVQENECSLVVGKADTFTEADAVVLRDIAVGQTGLSASQIKVVDHSANPS